MENTKFLKTIRKLKKVNQIDTNYYILKILSEKLCGIKLQGRKKECSKLLRH